MSIAQRVPSADPGLINVLDAIAEACSNISSILKSAKGSRTGTQNDFGDQQLDIDIAADEVVYEALRSSNAVSYASSEETPTEVPLGGAGYSCVTIFNSL